MSIIAKLPDSARVQYPVVRFQSSNLLLGDYAFENAGNTDVLLMDNLNAGSLYLVERISFFASAFEGDWLKSMKAAIDFPRISVRFSRIGGASIFGGPFRCVNYIDNNEQLIYLKPSQAGDTLVSSMYGTVAQVAGMVGELFLVAQMNLTVYEVTDKRWIKSFLMDPDFLGATLRV